MNGYLIKGAQVVNEGKTFEADVLVKHGRISRIDRDISDQTAKVIEAEGLHLLPGVIDDQVHFREPGLTHKAEIYTEARAAVAGGVTSFMEMPNTKPPALTINLLENKYQIARERSLANYSFFMGVSNDNADEAVRVDVSNVCGLKIFMGSSTGNMLVDSEQTLRQIFRNSPCLIATHCEDEQTVRANMEMYRNQFGDQVAMEMHPLIRSVDACYMSSSMARELAEEYGTRLHILHISTAKETKLFRNDIPLQDKRITSEACVHHLWYTADDYARLGGKIKCNPAIKEGFNRDGIWEALLDDRIDVIATDHAPHTMAEKDNNYFECPSGLPLVQHPLLMMLSCVQAGRISLERVVEKMSHAVATCFQIKERGFLREDYWADLVLVDLAAETLVRAEELEYKCGWSPLEGERLAGRIRNTMVSGHMAYSDGQFDESKKGERLRFER